MSIAETLGVTGAAVNTLGRLPAPLLHWYDRCARDLPWRQNTDPYRVWVSEIMLQQTRVEAVRDHYTRFLAELPTIAHLAAVDMDRLLKLWEGLGYYSRARNLKRAALAVMDRHGGELPRTFRELRALPGIGDYTAGAISSISFGERVPAVDGNVHRVVARILASRADVSKPPVKAVIRDAVAAVVPEHRPGDFNQALMELGATVCLPNSAPLCPGCPVAEHCAALRTGTAADLPQKAPKKARRVERRTILLLTDGERLLIFQRQEPLLAGMFEPLNLTGHLRPIDVEEAVAHMGGEPLDIVPLEGAKHLFTHVEWQMKAYRVDCEPFDVPGGRWVNRDALAGDFALPSAFRSIVAQW